MITIDANVYISAFQFGGRPMELLERILDSGVEVAVSEPILNETLRVLHEKFHWSDEERKAGRAVILSLAKMFQPKEPVMEVTEDPADNRILECAVASRSKWLVTGDKDLLRRGQYQGIKIVPVRDFLELGIVP